MRLRKQNNSAYDIRREMSELQKGMDELGIAFSKDALEKFEAYLGVLYSYHGKVHLLSHRDYQRISRRHFLPSLVALPYVKDRKRICDVGSGAGFPSLPLKIFLTNTQLVIFEAQRKKADFLRLLIDTLNLEDVKIMNERAEHYAGERFDLALLRAVGKIKKLIGILDPLLQPGGEAIFFKSPGVDKEIEEAQKALHERNFRVSITKALTPLDRLPLAIVVLNKS
jgi:16S rRNA (guanine527-N7)-methyltransferase